LILRAAALATVLFQRLKLPVIVGYLVAGMLVGPLAPRRLIHDPETIRTLAELGVVLLLFSIGLEFRFRRLTALGPRVALATLVEVGLMLLLGYGAARGLGWVGLPALLAAGMVAISSTMVVSRTLAERHADRRLRDIVFGVLVMEDLVAILLIAVLTTLVAGDTFSGPVRDLFAAVFFVAVGMLFDPAALAAVWPAALVLTLVVLSGKVAGVAAGVFLAGYGTRNAIRSGMNLAQIGEFSFVIAGLGTVA